MGQTAVGNLVQADDAGRAFCNSILRSEHRWVSRHCKPPLCWHHGSAAARRVEHL